MAKIKLTKGELKRQRDSLTQFQHYLPTLQLKKQQLQMKIRDVRAVLLKKSVELNYIERKIKSWVGLLADPLLEEVGLLAEGTSPAEGRRFDIRAWVVPSEEDVHIETQNIAGANLPVLKQVTFPPVDYDLYATPYWVDRGIEEIQEYMRRLLEVENFKHQVSVLQNELRVTTQRVNLFEKVKIPECLENIRVIRIYLGDLQTNAVGISKVAKKKIQAADIFEPVAT